MRSLLSEDHLGDVSFSSISVNVPSSRQGKRSRYLNRQSMDCFVPRNDRQMSRPSIWQKYNLQKSSKSTYSLPVYLSETSQSQRTMISYNLSETESISGMQRKIVSSRLLLESNSRSVFLMHKFIFLEQKSDTVTFMESRKFQNLKIYSFDKNFSSSLYLSTKKSPIRGFWLFRRSFSRRCRSRGDYDLFSRK